MQQQENHGLDRLVHMIDPFFNYLIFFLHMFVTCYLTLLLYFALGPEVNGTFSIFGFFLDWNLIAILTLPFMHMSKKFVQHPLGLVTMGILFLAVMMLFVRLSQDKIVMTVLEGLNTYHLIVLKVLFG